MGIRDRLRECRRLRETRASRISNVLEWDSSLDNEDGRGLTMALLDSGLHWEHRAFSGATFRAQDFTGSRQLFDASGHGTSSASLLIGQPASGFHGLVPSAQLMCARVLGADREATIVAVARAIQWSVEQGAEFIVLPFGTRQGAARIAHAVTWAARAGVTILAAAGNRGPEQLCFPAWMDEVIAVTGVDALGFALPSCCALRLADRAALGDSVPAITPDGPALLRGSSPAVVVAAGLMGLQRAARSRVSNEPRVRGGDTWATTPMS
jgi:subtilisin family serine protease